MALFKVFKGGSAQLNNQTKVDGYCWFTYDNGKFYIDYKINPNDNDEEVKRQALNAEQADKDSLGNLIHSVYAAELDLSGHTLQLLAKDRTVLDTITLPDTTYTFADGTNGSFTVTPTGGQAQTVSIGKPAAAGTADSVAWTGITNKPTSYNPQKAADNVLGGIKTGYSESGKNYAVKVDGNGNAYVYVPWMNSTYTFDGTYNASTNKAATVSTVTNAINALDVNDITGFGTGKTLKTLTETNGKISATFQDIAITKDQVSGLPTNLSEFTNDAGYLTSSTDYNVRQTNDASNNANYRLLLSNSDNDIEEDSISRKNANLTFNPSTNKLSTINLDLTGELDVVGNAYLHNQTTADSLSAGSLIVTGNTNFVQIPTAPTAPAGDNSLKLATTEFVSNSVAGLSGAMHFKGTTITEITDGSTTNPITIGNSSYTAEAGDVVLREISGNTFEYVWTGSVWEMLGRDADFKVRQSQAVDTGTAATNTWVSRIQQNTNGDITATMGTLDTSGTWSGNATTATTASKLSNTSKIGDINKPVYFTAGGVPAAISYTIGKSVPSDAVFTDTKNTAGSTNTTSKIYLIGATSQADNPQTYSDEEVYTTSGTLTAKKLQLTTTAAEVITVSRTDGVNYIHAPATGGLAICASDNSVALATSSFIADATGVRSGKNNTFDLGTSTYKWKNVYATNFYGSGANLTNIDGSNISSGTVAFDRLPSMYWANIAIANAASYNTTPEVATIKLNGDTNATAASTKNVVLQYDSTLEVLNFVFS